MITAIIHLFLVFFLTVSDCASVKPLHKAAGAEGRQRGSGKAYRLKIPELIGNYTAVPVSELPEFLLNQISLLNQMASAKRDFYLANQDHLVRELNCEQFFTRLAEIFHRVVEPSKGLMKNLHC